MKINGIEITKQDEKDSKKIIYVIGGHYERQ